MRVKHVFVGNCCCCLLKIWACNVLTAVKLLSMWTFAVQSLRVLQIKPFGDGISRCFQVFVDDRDEGKVITTHIYLLVGCSCPLWLHNGILDASVTSSWKFRQSYCHWICQRNLFFITYQNCILSVLYYLNSLALLSSVAVTTTTFSFV